MTSAPWNGTVGLWSGSNSPRKPATITCALEARPDRMEVRMRLANLYLDRNDPGLAGPHLAILEKALPDRPEVLLEVGRYQFLRGEENEARATFDRLLAIMPDSTSALVYRGILELEENPPRPEAAEPFFRRASKGAPNDAPAHNALSNCLRAMPGREAEGEAELKKHDQLVATAKRIQTLLAGDIPKSARGANQAYELGSLYLDLGRDDVALYWLRIAEKRDANHKPTHALLADFFEKKGDKDQAAQERSQAAP